MSTSIMMKVEVLSKSQREETRPLLQYMAGYLMSTLTEYKTPRRYITKLMPFKMTKLLMFLTMSPQVDVMTKTKGG